MLTADYILSFLKENRTYFKEQFHCVEIGLFGSFARNEQTSESDIDFLVVFEKDAPDLYETEIRLKSFLKQRFGREIDICSKKWIKPIFKPIILQEARYA